MKKKKKYFELKSDTIKCFRSQISRAFSFYARELNLEAKCRQINKLYCEIIKSRGKYGEKMKF